jgi:hypothetical protein
MLSEPSVQKKTKLPCEPPLLRDPEEERMPERCAAKRNVRVEQTGWRDLSLNNRHRLWGWDCPATDIDFIEYTGGRPVALVEYKSAGAEVNFDGHNLRALVELANRAGLPAYLVRYKSDFSLWQVLPLNAKARAYVPRPAVMTELGYVTLLYRLRGQSVPVEVARMLKASALANEPKVR